MGKIEKVILSNSKGNSLSKLVDEYEAPKGQFYWHVDTMVIKKKISIPDRDLLFYSDFGKLNPYGRCGSARPDIFIMSLYEGNRAYDLVHISEGTPLPPQHMIGTNYYEDFMKIIFGDLPEFAVVTKDIPYSFSKSFLDKLIK